MIPVRFIELNFSGKPKLIGVSSIAWVETFNNRCEIIILVGSARWTFAPDETYETVKAKIENAIRSR